jgi:hypothetical protein
MPIQAAPIARKMGPQGSPSSCNSFATGNTSVHAPSTWVKVVGSYRFRASPDGRMCI